MLLVVLFPLVENPLLEVRTNLLCLRSFFGNESPRDGADVSLAIVSFLLVEVQLQESRVAGEHFLRHRIDSDRVLVCPISTVRDVTRVAEHAARQEAVAARALPSYRSIER